MSKMENCESETPRKKRPFLEVSISPDGKAAMNTSDLRDVLGDILDQKLEEHLKSIKDDFAQLKTSAETQQLETSQAISNIKRECEEVKAENNLLRKQVLKLESFQRKNNLKLVGLKENKSEIIEIAVLSIFNEFLQTSHRFDERTLEHVHRLGPFQNGKRRDVLARFANFKIS